MANFYRVSIEKVVYSFPCIDVSEANHFTPGNIDDYIISESRSIVREHPTEESAVAHAMRYVEWSQKRKLPPVQWDWDYASAGEDRLLVTFTQPIIAKIHESKHTIIPDDGIDCWDLGYIDDHLYAQDVANTANTVMWRLGKGQLIHPKQRIGIDMP